VQRLNIAQCWQVRARGSRYDICTEVPWYLGLCFQHFVIKVNLRAENVKEVELRCNDIFHVEPASNGADYAVAILSGNSLYDSTVVLPFRDIPSCLGSAGAFALADWPERFPFSVQERPSQG
jgi:hypothetical protein